MSIRSIILGASIPLLILLAAVNGALLYFQSRAEMTRGLDARALAAAVTGAEFLSGPERPEAIVADPRRRAAIAAAAQHVEGFDGYYWIGRDHRVTPLMAAGAQRAPPVVDAPRAPMVLPVAIDASGHRHVVALAPVAGDGFVAARFDAEPLFDRMSELRRWILVGIGLAALLGLGAGWYVARRIGRELDTSRRTMLAFDTGAAPPDASGLVIAEAADLAGALRLVDANRAAQRYQLARRVGDQDRLRDTAGTFATWRAAQFTPIAVSLAGAEVAARLCGDAAPGAFFAPCGGVGDAALVVGECAGDDPADALALALAARAFLQREWSVLGGDRTLALAREAFAFTRFDHKRWTAADAPAEPWLLALSDAESERRARLYAAADPGAAPGPTLDRLAVLLEPDGVFAMLRRG